MTTTTEDNSKKTTPQLRSFPVGATFNPYKLFTGIFIPEALVKVNYKLLSPGAKLCYGRLARFAGKDGKCYPSMETLGRELGVTGRQARSYLSELESEKLVQRVGEQGKVNHFQFLWHSLFNEPRKNTAGVEVLRKNTAGVLRKDASAKESQGKRVPDSDLDVDIDMANRKNRASPLVISPPRKPKPRTKCKAYPDLRNMLGSYMSGGGNATVWPTDRQVVEVMKAAGGADEKAVMSHLRHLFMERGLRPGTDQGPEHWTWFVAVIKDAAENGKL